MENTKEFLQTIPRSFNPDSYVELSRRGFREGISYFISLVLVTFFIMVLLFLPKAAFIPGQVATEFNHFSTLKINPEIEMTEPFELDVVGPFLKIDTTQNHTTLGEESFLITREKLFFSFLWKEQHIDLNTFEDVKGNQDAFFTMFWLLLVLLAPSLLFLFYIAMLLKYLLLVFLFSGLAFAAMKASKRKLRFKQILNIGLYGSTIPLLLEAVTRPYLGNFYYIPLIIFTIYFLIAVILNADR